MKKLILSSLFLPFAGGTAFYGGHTTSSGHTTTSGGHTTSNNIVEVRKGDWPMNLQREDNASYSLIFRDQEVMSAVVLDTLPFPNVEQLRYFGKALSTLKVANNGDIAQFKDYSIKRADKKFEQTQYILRIKWGITDFQQPEADIMINAIKKL